MQKLAFVLLLAPALAVGEPKTPDGWYKEGETQYNLGNFDGAVDAFKKGFELETNESKRPAYLFNVAQAYRQAKNCKDAVFFYKRYLALKENDKVKPLSEKKRAEVEKIIDELDDCAKQQEALTKKPPDKNPDDEKQPEKPVAVATVEPPKDEKPEQPPVEAPAQPPHVISVRALGGAAKISTGNLAVPVQASLGLVAGVPLSLGDLTLELGAAFLFSPVPYEDAMNASHSAQMISVLGDLGATYRVHPRVGIRGDLGAGVLVFGGVSDSPFTDDKPTTGALTMLEVRVGASVDIAITPNVVATVAPIAFSYSPAKTGLRSDITSITRLDFMIGLGYRM
jgi:tetratricopeptide (TPR) repeat protein